MDLLVVASSNFPGLYAEGPASLLEYTIHVCVSGKFCILSMIRYACFASEIFDVH